MRCDADTLSTSYPVLTREHPAPIVLTVVHSDLTYVPGYATVEWQYAFKKLFVDPKSNHQYFSEISIALDEYIAIRARI